MKKSTCIAAVVAAGALIAPAGASAHMETAVSSVQAHTDRADAALDRAVALYEDRAAKRGDRALAKSRRQMAAAKREAAKLRREADTPDEHADAAAALALVAAQQDENVDALTGALDEARARSERKVAAAALADTRGREKALAVLTALLDELPEAGAAGVANAIAALSQDRDEEIEEGAEALVDGDVTAKSKRKVARSIEANVDGQATAAERLAALIAGDDVPEQGKAGLQTAYDAVVAESTEAAEVLSQFSDRMPARIRAFVEQVVRQAREDARSMRENRPAPPSGQPEGTPSGQPEGTPSGQPEGTPSGQPEETPSGQPEQVPPTA